jgi:gliding motility-associated-like protein
VSIAWQREISNNWVTIAGQTGDTLALTNVSLNSNPYEVRAIVTNKGGCSDTTNIERVDVVQRLTPFVVIQSTDNEKCEGETFFFEVVVDNIRSQGYISTYQWQVNNLNLSGQTGDTLQTSTLNDGDSVNVIMTPDPALCLTTPFTTSNRIDIGVDEKPNPGEIVDGNRSICYKDEVAFEVEGTTGTITWYSSLGGYNWQPVPGNGNTTLNLVPSDYHNFLVSDPFTSYYIVQVDLNNECEPVWGDSVTVMEYPELEGSAEVFQDCEIYEAELTIDDSHPYTTFSSWEISRDGENWTMLDEPGTFTVTDTSIKAAFYRANFYYQPGCYLSDTVFVEDCPDPEIKLPNALTPNGDSDNQTFYIDNIWFYPDNTLRIYNRWGSLVWETNGYNNEWEGTAMNGQKLPVSTYYFVLDLGNGKTYQGPISLIR